MTSDPRRKQRLVLGLIAGAVLAWGAMQALGAYLFNYHPGRPVIVMACVSAFLGVWLLLLAARGPARHSHGDRDDARREDSLNGD